MKKFVPSMLVAMSLTAAAHAAVITQWNFNSVPSDANVATGTNTPNVGTGTLSLLGGVTQTYATGSPDDTNATDNSGLNTTTYPAATAGSGTAGVLFSTSTAGMTGGLSISLDFRESATASRYFQLLVSSNGSTFSAPSGGTATVASSPTPNTATSFSSTGLFADTSGSGSQTFVQGISYTFPAGSVYENDPTFAFEWVSVFDPTIGTSYTASNSPTSAYSTAGTARFDEVTVSVPEPASLGLALCGATALLARRRRLVR